MQMLSFVLVYKEKDSWKYHTTHCDPGWTPFNRKCYKLKKEKRTWQEALHSCQSDDSMLMDVTSLAEVELLVNLLGDGEYQRPLPQDL